MLDFGHFPSKAQVFTFYGNAPASQTSWQNWQKPRGISFCYIFALGGGGGGGPGTTGAVGAAGGGGGGGSSAQNTLFISAAFLPDTLFLSVGNGGKPGNGGLATYVQIAPSTTANDVILRSFGGAGGLQGTAGAGGAGGAGGAVPTIAAGPLAGLGKYTFLVGQTGATGGFNGAGLDLAYPVTGLVVSGGAGGGAIQAAVGSAGGSVTGAGVIPTSSGGAAGVSGVNGEIGSHGVQLSNWIGIFTGGAGAGSGFPVATISDAGDGGNGSFGCGGGGGGSAVTGASGGGLRATYGGQGLVIIVCW